MCITTISVRIPFHNSETEYFGECRREMSRSSEFRGNSHELESMETNSRRPISSPKNTPTEYELEDFFAAAEKDIQKKFQEK